MAFGFKYDLAAAQRHGMRTAWVNRHGEPAPGPERPDQSGGTSGRLADVA